MSKRLVRLFPGNIAAALPALVGTELNVVRRDDRTVFGRLKAFSGELLDIRDLRGHAHRLALTDLAEIVYDRLAPSQS